MLNGTTAIIYAAAQADPTGNTETELRSAIGGIRNRELSHANGTIAWR